jgi:hypothetical protein
MLYSRSFFSSFSKGRRGHAYPILELLELVGLVFEIGFEFRELQFEFVNLGLVFGTGSFHLLSQPVLVGAAAARLWLFLSSSRSARPARQTGCIIGSIGLLLLGGEGGDSGRHRLGG